MNINATLLGQMITFALFIWFTMKYVWPPMIAALEERKQKIADGLAAAELGQQQLVDAKTERETILTAAKEEASTFIADAKTRATHMIEEAKAQAKLEGECLMKVAYAEIAQEKQAARDVLRKEVANLALSGAEKLLEANIDAAANAALFETFVKEL